MDKRVFQVLSPSGMPATVHKQFLEQTTSAAAGLERKSFSTSLYKMQEGAEGSQGHGVGDMLGFQVSGVGRHVNVRAEACGNGGSWTAGGPGLGSPLDNTGHTDRTDSLSEFQC